MKARVFSFAFLAKEGKEDRPKTWPLISFCFFFFSLVARLSWQSLCEEERSFLKARSVRLFQQQAKNRVHCYIVIRRSVSVNVISFDSVLQRIRRSNRKSRRRELFAQVCKQQPVSDRKNKVHRVRQGQR